jgi:hypothetical protein
MTFKKLEKKTVQLIGGGTHLFEPDLVALDQEPAMPGVCIEIPQI